MRASESGMAIDYDLICEKGLGHGVDKLRTTFELLEWMGISREEWTI